MICSLLRTIVFKGEAASQSTSAASAYIAAVLAAGCSPIKIVNGLGKIVASLIGPTLLICIDHSPHPSVKKYIIMYKNTLKCNIFIRKEWYKEN